MKKKILFYSDNILNLLYDINLPLGGSVKQTYAWGHILEKVGFDVQFIGGFNSEKYTLDDKRALVAFNPDKGIPKLRFFYKKLPSLINALRNSDAHYVYFSTPGPFVGILILALIGTKKKIILRISSDIFTENRVKNKFNFLNYLFFKSTFKNANVIICQNDFQYKNLLSKFPDKVFKLSNPYFGNLTSNPLPLSERKYIAWIGNIRYEKNIPLLLDIAIMMKDFKFVIAGKVLNHINPELKNTFRKLINLPNVRFIGFVNQSEITEILRKTTFLLNTSHYEGFSNTYLESFAVGTPVIVPHQNNPDDIVTKFDLGAVYKDKYEISSFVKENANSHYEYKKISNNCIKYMEQYHDPVNQASQFKEIIN